MISNEVVNMLRDLYCRNTVAEFRGAGEPNLD